MALKIAIVLVSISIALLATYGADVALSYTNDAKVGFLPFDHMTRGLGLGIPALVLPFISFFIARNDESKVHGGLLILSAILIIMGGVTVLLAKPESASSMERNPIMESGPLIIAGIIIAILGAIKLKRS
ncbi:MAG: putative membrane protein [Cenarchaeum symbiont of Oopsacas minuta]|nr:putative membrane protein [Cenarchaeum symbiont of Oopsacas minuta]